MNEPLTPSQRNEELLKVILLASRSPKDLDVEDVLKLISEEPTTIHLHKK